MGRSFFMEMSFMTGEQKESIHQMRGKKISYSQIAAALEISLNTVKSYCRRNGLQGNLLQSAKGDDAVCQQCGKRLNQKAKQKPKKFCSDQCRRAWWKDHQDRLNKKAVYVLTCAHCGAPFQSYGNKKRKYCSHACYIKDRFGEENAS